MLREGRADQPHGEVNVDTAAADVFRLPENFFDPIATELRDFVREFPWNFRCDYEPAEFEEAIFLKLSSDARKQLMKRQVDFPLANDKRNIRLPRGFAAALSSTLIDYLVHSEWTSAAAPSGSLLYPPGGWMGWHTNSDRAGWRLYITYTRTEGRSFFRWYDGENVKTSYDANGFTFRLFRVGSQTDLLWHCVYAHDWRLSLGYWLHDLNQALPGASVAALL
jgi:hypothetical protein